MLAQDRAGIWSPRGGRGEGTSSAATCFPAPSRSTASAPLGRLRLPRGPLAATSKRPPPTAPRVGCAGQGPLALSVVVRRLSQASGSYTGRAAPRRSPLEPGPPGGRGLRGKPQPRPTRSGGVLAGEMRRARSRSDRAALPLPGPILRPPARFGRSAAQLCPGALLAKVRRDVFTGGGGSKFVRVCVCVYVRVCARACVCGRESASEPGGGCAARPDIEQKWDSPPCGRYKRMMGKNLFSLVRVIMGVFPPSGTGPV